MKHFIFVFAFFVCMASATQAATEPVTAEIKDLDIKDREYTLIIKEGENVVVESDEEMGGGTIDPPEVQTFAAKYCGVPSQVVVLKSEPHSSMCGKAPGISCGIWWEFRIYNPETWGLMDEFVQADFKDLYIGEWTSHADGEHTIEVLRSGRYYGPKCRIFDLYTQPLPAQGPSFDCRTASNRAEETVCKHPELAALDRAYGARLRERLLKVSPAERQGSANGYYWDMRIRDNAGTNVKELAEAYRLALSTDSAQFFQVTPPSPEARIDCTKAHTPSEKAICADPKLLELDGQLAQAYQQALDRTQPESTGRSALIQAQRDWIESVHACQGKIPCLQKAYEDRIRMLQEMK